MRSLDEWGRTAAITALLGAAAWLAKLAVVVGTGGRVTDDGAAGVLFLLGAVLLIAGSTYLGVALTRGRPRWQRIAAVVLSPVLFVASVVALGVLQDLVLPSSVADHLADEVNVVGAALLWGLGAGWLLTRGQVAVG